MIKFCAVILFCLLFAGTYVYGQEIDTITIEAIDVSATLHDGEMRSIPGSVSLLTASQLAMQDEITIAQHLNTIPGIYMHNGTFNTNRIVIRGIGSRTPYGSNRIRAYLNDIPLTNGDGVTTLEDIDVNRIGRIEVMKGPNSAIYGSGLGGTIKLATRTMNNTLDTRYQYGSFNTQKLDATAGFQFQEGNITASVHRTYSDGYRQNNQYERYSLFFTADQRFGKTDFSYTLLINSLNGQIPSSINLETFLNTPEKAAQNWLSIKGYEQNSRLITGLTLHHRFSKYLSNKTTLFGGFSNSFEHRPFNDLDEQMGNYGVRSQFRFQKSTLSMIAGVELFNERYAWRTYLVENNIENTTADIDENRSFTNLFALANYEPITRVQLSAGINLNRLAYQYQGSSNKTDRYSYPYILSPRIGFNYRATNQLNLFGSVGHGFSHPSLEETLMPGGEKNPDLKPEQGFMVETGARLSALSNRLFIDATLYHIALNNMLVTKRITEEIFTGVNAGRTQHSGIELQTGYDLFNGESFPGTLKLIASLALSSNRFIDFIDDGKDFSGKQLPGIPSQTLYNGITWIPSNDLEINFNYRVAGSQYLNDANSGTVDGYQLFDIKASKPFSMGKCRIEITGGINNLFDTRYASMLLVNAPSFGSAAPRYYYPGLPRNFYLGVRIGI